MTRILIADDHALLRSGLRALFDSLGIEVVGEAHNGGQAVELAEHLRPDIVIMDIEMPQMDGIEATRRLAKSSPGVAVLVLTMHEDDESLFSAMRAGARGYLLKGAEQDDVVRAIDAVGRGEAIFGPAVASRILRFFAAGPRPTEPFPELTPRELEILDLLASGLSNGEIAKKLFLSPKTISNNVSMIFDKLQVADRSKAIVQARRAGFGEGPPVPTRLI
jgi:DNA-binding NarL/FixJ family response regulator